MTFKTSIFTLAFAGASALALISTASPSYAQTDIVEQAESVVQAVTESLPDVENQAFFKKKYRIKGTWSLITRDDKRFIVFSDDFKTKNGPDLKIFLSPKSAEDVTGKNAVDGALNLGVLIKNKGPQEYEIPEGTNLAQFSTVLVHCEAYAILWGGGAL